jgi:branched-chain amino acid transport system substrate-binding protein
MRSVRPRKRLGIALALLSAAALAAACGGGSGTGASDGAQEIVLGASVEVTGSGAAIGQQWQQGIQLAVDKANGDQGFLVGGKRYRWKLDLRDNKTLPDQAIANYRAFTGEKAKYILGPGVSTAFIPAMNALGNGDRIVMTPSVAAAQFIGKPGGNNLFITHLSDTGDNGRVAKMVQTLQANYHAKRVAVLLPQDDAGELYTKAFTQYFTAAGAQVVYNKAFPGDTRDFSSYITALKAAGPDLVVSGYLDTWMRPFLEQSVGAGFTSPVFVGAPGTNVTSVGQPGSAIQNFAWSVTTRAVDNAADPQVQAYRAAYNAKFGAEPGAAGFWGLSYYDPILMLTKAMQDAGTVDDPKAVADAMLKVTQWPDAALAEHFDPATKQAVYTPQIGLYAAGKVTYVEAK